MPAPYHALVTPPVGNAPLVFAFHGTGGDETQLAGMVRSILPEAGLVAPRGDVSEGGANRFFRRTGEGIYDMPDLARRSAAGPTEPHLPLITEAEGVIIVVFRRAVLPPPDD